MAQTRTITKKKLFILGVLDFIARGLHFFRVPHASRDHPRKILVLEPWGIGDVVLSTPLLRALRTHFPAAHIALLAKPHAESLLENTGLIDELIPFDFPWTAFSGKFRLGRYRLREMAALIRRLRSSDFDLSLDARRDIRSNVIAYLGGARRRIGYDFGGGSHLLTDVIESGDQNDHKVDDWMALLRPLGIEPQSGAATELRVLDAEKLAARRMLSAAGIQSSATIVGIHPGASHSVRHWSREKFAEVIDELAARGISPVIFAEKGAADPAIPHNASVPVIFTTLRELMACIAVCDAFVCSDSGPMHIAVALDVPVTAIFGPQRSEWYGPRGKSHRIVQVEKMACRPCFDACIFTTAHCMDGVAPKAVLESVESQLQELSGTDAVVRFTELQPPTH